MGDRITFRDRDSRKDWRRVSFLKGEVTTGTPGSGLVACGPGTPFSLLVTGEEWAEMVFRVKDAKMSGSILAGYSFASMELKFTTADMEAENYSGSSSDVIVQRAYADTESPPANLTDEGKIWVGPLSTPDSSVTPGLPSWWTLTHGLVTGFTHYAESIAVTSGYYPYGESGGVEWQAAVEIAFSSSAAWVDITESGNPFDPGNQLWMGVEFQAFTWDQIGLDGVTTGLAMVYVDAYSVMTGDPNEGEIGDLTFVLSGGSVSCKLYASNFSFLESYSCDITITAKKWWPYATKAGLGAWNETTGAPANGGPGA